MLLETDGYRYDGVYVHVPGGRVPTIFYYMYYILYLLFSVHTATVFRPHGKHPWWRSSRYVFFTTYRDLLRKNQMSFHRVVANNSWNVKDGFWVEFAKPHFCLTEV